MSEGQVEKNAGDSGIASRRIRNVASDLNRWGPPYQAQAPAIRGERCQGQSEAPQRRAEPQAHQDLQRDKISSASDLVQSRAGRSSMARAEVKAAERR